MPGEVLVSGVIPSMVVGSPIKFADRGDHRLKGVRDTWRLYALVAD
jgi:class 3 adenylate cyclase